MEIRTLTCSSCGAQLDLPDATNYVTCRHCGANLAIVREDHAASEKIAQLTQTTERLTQRVAELTGQNDADQIVPSFRHRGLRILSPYRSSHDTAAEQRPQAAAGALAIGLFACVFGIYMMNWPMIIGGSLGVLFGAVGLFLGRPLKHRPIRRERRELELPTSEPTPDR